MIRVASIDVGTNTVRLLILEKEPDGDLREIAQERAITRLGEGMDTEKRLLDHRMDGTISVLAEFRKKCQKFEPLTIRAVATSAVREAGNQGEFVSRAREEAGIEIPFYQKLPGEIILIILITEVLCIFGDPLFSRKEDT